jgi:hypothetical protein
VAVAHGVHGLWWLPMIISPSERGRLILALVEHFLHACHDRHGIYVLWTIGPYHEFSSI